MAISPERLDQAFADSVSFSFYLEHAKNNADAMRENYESYALSDSERERLSSLEELHVLAIVEDWCPDCTASVPLFARVDEAIDTFHLHVLVREPGNGDVGAAYPASDGRSRIPTYVFFDAGRHELGVFIERPEAINALFEKLRVDFAAEHEEVDLDNFVDSLSPELRSEFADRMKALRHDNRELEKRELLAAIIAIATSKVSA